MAIFQTAFYCFLVFLKVLIIVNSLPHEEIYNGEISQLGDHPYHAYVSIQYLDKNNLQIGCNGVIIDDTHVVTAAHCVTDDEVKIIDPEQTIVVVEAGTVFLNDQPAYQGYVDGIYLPAGFTRDNQSVHGDIAVLKLAKKIVFNDNLRVIELPDKSKTYESEVATLTGFGYSHVNHTLRPDGKYDVAGTSDDRLRYGTTDVLKEEDCYQAISSKTKLNFDDQLCARMRQPSDDSYRGACRGDSGSPLVVKDMKTKKIILVGVLSFATFYCIEKNKASIYTRVSSYVDFIKIAQADKINDPGVMFTQLLYDNSNEI